MPGPESYLFPAPLQVFFGFFRRFAKGYPGRLAHR
jgi:hypothetical protein